MAWTKIDGRILTIDEVRTEIAGTTWRDWRPSGGVLHNTASPSLGRSQAFSIEHWRDMWEGFYRDTQHWSAGPHYFCFPGKKVLCFTPITSRGVHSPSWNGTKFGVEMVADFDKEDDDAGLGLEVKMAAVAVFAALYAKLGLDPAGIKLHKEDPRTTHACPGRDIDKAEFIQLVQEYMGDAGEHPGGTVPPPAPAMKVGIVNVALGDTLNVRSQASASAPVVTKLVNGETVSILSEAMNGSTKWLRVEHLITSGWVAARYINPA